MNKIAIVTAFSERCIPLVKQFLVSCYLATEQCKTAKFHYFVYACNWIGDIPELVNAPLTLRTPPVKTMKPFFPFSRTINLYNELLLPNCEFTQLDAANLNNEYSWLPDIITYQDFCDKYMKDFDYVLFCHDDIIVNHKMDLFSYLIAIIENQQETSLFGEIHLECFDYISARIYPHFVFVKVSQFLDLELSWANSYKIFNDGIKARDIYDDGGAGLLASIYRKGSKFNRPYFKVGKNLFHHLRIPNISVGIETAIINNGYTTDISSLFEYAEKFVASNLWVK